MQIRNPAELLSKYTSIFSEFRWENVKPGKACSFFVNFNSFSFIFELSDITQQNGTKYGARIDKKRVISIILLSDVAQQFLTIFFTFLSFSHWFISEKTIIYWLLYRATLLSRFRRFWCILTQFLSILWWVRIWT